MGVTSRTHPGLYRRGGLEAADNLVRSEWMRAESALSDFPVSEGTDYLEPRAFLDAVREELAGRPIAQHEDAEAAALEAEGREEFERALAEAGVDLEAMTDDAAAEALLAREAAALDDLFQPPRRKATPVEAARRDLAKLVVRFGRMDSRNPTARYWALEDQVAAAERELAALEGRPERELDHVLADASLWEQFNQAAFHGTRVKALEGGRFSLGKIGTGEGAAAYGWGLYFSSKREIADFYRLSLSDRARLVLLDGAPIGDSRVGPGARSRGGEFREWWEAAQAGRLGGTPEAAEAHMRALAEEDVALSVRSMLGASEPIERGVERVREGIERAVEVEGFGRKPDAAAVAWQRARLDALDRIAAGRLTSEIPGQVFKVDLPADAELMDWDKPLAEQSEGVRASLADLQPGFGFTDGTTGKQIYESLVRRFVNPQKASERLAAAGIKGHRYKGHESGATNYVIYDDAAVSVVETYYQGGRQQGLFGGMAELSPDAEKLLGYFARSSGSASTVAHARPALAQLQGPRFDDALAELEGEGLVELAASEFTTDPEARSVKLTKAARERRGLDRPAGRSREDGSEQGSLFQGPEAARGSITFDPALRQAVIAFTATADASTAIHELGHYYTLGLLRESQLPDAPAWVKDDARTLRIFAGLPEEFVGGVLGGATGEPTTALEREAAERLADAFVAYVREGRAPSLELRAAFGRMREWLVQLYRTVRELLGAEGLSDDVRAVFDRMLATDEEIARARESDALTSIFAADQLTDAERAELEAALRMADDTTRGQVDRAQLREAAKARGLFEKVAKEREKLRRAEYQRIREEVDGELARDRAWQADSFLRTGQFIGRATPEGMEPVKLSRPAMLELFGADSEAGRAILAVPTGARSWLSATAGVHPDAVAEALGYDVGAELVRALLAIDSREAGSRERVADGVARQRLRELGTLSPGELEEQALRALSGPALVDFLLVQDRLLSARTGEPAAPVELARAAAERIVGQKRAQDLRPDLHRATALRARREALLATRDGDFRKAQGHLRRELLHRVLETMTREAREEAAAIVTKGRRFDRDVKLRKRLGLARGGYLEAVDELLEGVELRVIPIAELQRRRRNMAEWLLEREAAGDSIVVPDWVREAGRKPWRTLTMTELRGLAAMLDSIEHAARLALETTLGEERIDRAALVAQVIRELDAGVLRDATRSARLSASATDRFFAFWRRFDRDMLGAEALVSSLVASDPTSALYGHFIAPVAQGDAEHLERMATRVAPLRKLAELYQKQRPREYWEEILPETRLAMPARFGLGPRPFELTRRDLLGMAAYLGSRSGSEKLLGGFGWWDGEDFTFDTARGRVLDVLDDHLSERDFELVRAGWELLEEWWPLVRDHEQALGGVAPEKVEALPWDTRSGIQMPGGYFPVIYDPTRSERAALQEAADILKQRPEGFGKVETRHPFTKARTKLRSRAVRIDFFGTIFNHLEEVSLDLAFRRPLQDAYRTLLDADLQDALRTKLGHEFGFQQFWLPWLQTIAGDTRTRAGIEPLEGIVRGMRRRAQTFALLGRLPTIAVQWTGLSNGLQGLVENVEGRTVGAGTRHLVAGKYLGEALWSLTGGRPFERESALAAAMERSAMLRHRVEAYDREVSEIRRELEGRAGFEPRVVLMAAKALAGAQLYMVDLPVWTAAYRLAKAQGREEAAAILQADSTVKLSQGSGSLTTQARVLATRNEYARALTLFYTYASAQFGQVRGSWRRHHSVTATTAAFLQAVWVPATLGYFTVQLVKACLPGGAPDDPEEWDERITEALFGAAMNPFPIVRELWRLTLPPERRFKSLPGAFGVWGGAVEDVAGGFWRGVRRGEWDRLVWSAAQLLGLSRGLPAAWPLETAEKALEEEETARRGSRRGSRRGTHRGGG
jgi:hypothetical protein